jgi:hypothetical protein
MGFSFEPGGVVMEWFDDKLFPSSSRRGGRDINKLSRSVLSGADGVVTHFLQIGHHPVCAAKDAPRLFLNRAATPPRRGGEKLVLNELQTTPADIHIVPNAHGD